MTLYEMTQNAVALYELLQMEEIDEQTYLDTLEAMGAEEKIESYCQIIKQLQADVEMLATEAARIAARKKTAENSIDRMKAALLAYMQMTKQTKAKGGTFSVSVASTQTVNVTDESKVPSQWLVPQPPKVDKVGLKEALKGGATIEGAELITTEGVRIR